MLDTKIEINFQINDEFIPYGENKPTNTLEEYKNLIENEVKVFLRGMYPEYENLKINITTNSL
jgi:hypothetical protein